jgi:tetratricopeptide (TPR) repeat protein
MVNVIDLFTPASLRTRPAPQMPESGGDTYDEQKEYDLAIQDYTEAIRLNPKFAIAYYNRGISYRKKKEYGLAIQDYTEAIRLNAKYADAYNNRGWSYYNKKEYDLAIQDYETALRLDPNVANAAINLKNAKEAKAKQGR